MTEEPFRFCIQCSDARETENVRLEFRKKKDFQEWVETMKKNILEQMYMTEDDLKCLQEKAEEHFS